MYIASHTLALELSFHFISRLIIALSVITPVNFLLCAGRLVNITGDVLLASGVVAYLGAFDARYRKAIIQGWQKLGKEQKIPCSNEFSLTNILGDQVHRVFHKLKNNQGQSQKIGLLRF